MMPLFAGWLNWFRLYMTTNNTLQKQTKTDTKNNNQYVVPPLHIVVLILYETYIYIDVFALQGITQTRGQCYLTDTCRP